MDNKIKETDFQIAKNWPGEQHVDNDLILLDQLSEAPFPTEPRRMNFILIGLCTKGSVRYRMDMQEQTIHPGQILIVSERHVIDDYQASPDLEGLCMMVSVPFYQEIIHNVSDVSSLFIFAHDHPVIDVSERDQQKFCEYFQVIRNKTVDTENHFRRDLVRTLMLAMFYDLSNVIYHSHQANEKRQTRGDIVFTQFIRLVGQHCRHERRVSWYAEQLKITPKYLSELVKQSSRRTPNTWIDNYVILEARVLLKNTTKSIREISEELNFPNQSFLGKYFKEHVGMSPSEYRRS